LDGGVTWAQIYPREIAPWSEFNATLKSVPDHAGHLFFTSGPQGGAGSSHPAVNPFMRSTDGGASWNAVPGVLEVRAFGFGRSRTDYPIIFITGWVHNEYGIWQSEDAAKSWTRIGEFPLGSLDFVKVIEGDQNITGLVYLGFSGSGFAYGESTSAQLNGRKDVRPGDLRKRE
jgi:hypothetical protein